MSVEDGLSTQVIPGVHVVAHADGGKVLVFGDIADSHYACVLDDADMNALGVALLDPDGPDWLESRVMDVADAARARGATEEADRIESAVRSVREVWSGVDTTGDTERDVESLHKWTGSLLHRVVVGRGEGARPVSKRGLVRPWKVTFQFPHMPKRATRAKADELEAMREGQAIARRGAEVWIYHVDPETGVETDLAHYDDDNPPPADELVDVDA